MHHYHRNSIIMKKKIIPLTLVLFGFLIGASALSALAQTWTAPSSGCTPPNCNTPTPLNVSATEQIKLGSLILNSTTQSPAEVGLTVFGKIKIPDGAAAGKVLTSVDSSGKAEWRTLSMHGEGVKCPIDGEFYDPGGTAGHPNDFFWKCINGNVRYITGEAEVYAAAFPTVDIPNRTKSTMGNFNFWGYTYSIGFSVDSQNHLIRACYSGTTAPCTGGTASSIYCNWSGDIKVSNGTTFTCKNNVLDAIAPAPFKMRPS